jgi:hypothetical protein
VLLVEFKLDIGDTTDGRDEYFLGRQAQPLAVRNREESGEGLRGSGYTYIQWIAHIGDCRDHIQWTRSACHYDLSFLIQPHK